MKPSLILFLAFSVPLVIGCGGGPHDVYQGYVEGNYVYIASNLPGRLEKLDAVKGGIVAQGQNIFALERDYETEGVRQAEAQMNQAEAQVAEAEARLQQAEAQVRQAQAKVDQTEATVRQSEAALRDLGTGLRPEELEQIEATLKRARTALELSEKELARREDLFSREIISREDLDRAESTVTADRAAVRELEAKLAVGKLPARSERIGVAEAEVSAAEFILEQARAGLVLAEAQHAQAKAGLDQALAAKNQAAAGLAQARWTLEQKIMQAPVAGLVFDLLHQVGDWVPAGSPVVALLPPENIKVRFFVPQAKLSAVKLGGAVEVRMDGQNQPVDAEISYISTQPEYTPPIIYSQDFRDKLVFLVEAQFPGETAARMHPGQPVDVRLQ